MKLYLVCITSWEDNFTIAVFDSLDKAINYCRTTDWRLYYDLDVYDFELNKEYEYDDKAEDSLYAQKRVVR